MEVDDNDAPTCTLDHFVELAQVEQMIAELKTNHDKNFEKSYEIFSNILSRYQELPHLLNPHLPALIEQLLDFIRAKDVPSTLFHAAFKYLYQITKVRTYKVILKFLPHEITDLDFVLNSLEQQDIADKTAWETRYMLIVWLSILVLNPFELARFDAFISSDSGNSDGEKPQSKMDRIYNLCLLNTNNSDTCSNVAAFLTAKFLIRLDIKDKYLPMYLAWVSETNEQEHYGKLAAVSSILKHGKREDLLVHAPKILAWMLSGDYKSNNDFLKNKYFVKIIQRLGLVFLKPRLAKWRYQRGSRSLTAKLAVGDSTKDAIEFQHDEITAEENDDDVEVPSEIEEIIEELLQAMRNPSSDIRWSAAKGIGRITSRLPKEFGDEVVGSVVEILNPLEPHEAWHGACLSIAELAKRGLLLPYRLETLVPLLLQALVYDELQGYMSVGQHIRDAACYMCWAFARAYEPTVLKDFVEKIAAGLLITTVFDREINCRRAASAAFQESVGRLRTFPHGIDILTKADFFSVGLRTNSYLEISDYIAQYPEYSRPLIDHLVNRKVNHWDPAIRELTSKTLHRLTVREPSYMANEVLPKLLLKISSVDINERHGTVLAIGEIVAKLRSLEVESDNKTIFINKMLTERLNRLVAVFQQRDQFRGLSGEMMFQCCCEFIRNCSASKISASVECIESWQLVIDSSLVKNSIPIRDAAVAALAELCKSYYNDSNSINRNEQLLEKYLTASKEESWEFVRMGYVSAIGALPCFILILKPKEILITLIAHSLTPVDRQMYFQSETPCDGSAVANWAEARKESVKALANVIQSIGFDEIGKMTLLDGKALDKIFGCLLLALNEYTIDNRGDIGAWVREAAMNALYKIIVTLPHDQLDEEKVHAVVSGLLQQSVEKIDRTRALAGKLFCKIIYNDPPIPFIKHHDFIKNVFPEDYSNILWLYAAHTFPLFCTLLELPEYTERLMIGLIASIGQLTESLVKYSSESLMDFLRKHPDQQKRICDVVIDIFNENTLNERVSYPLLNFLNIIISSGVIDDIVLDPSSTFSTEVFRLTKLEIKGHKKLYKLVSSINVFCQLIQVPSLCTKVLSTLSIFLGLPHVHVRKSTATKLYEALILHADACDIAEENLDEIMNILSETDWGQPITEIRLIRNKLCQLLNIKPPVTSAPAK